MKRTILIIIGIIFIILLIAVWLYTLFFSPSPSQPTDTYATFGEGAARETDPIEDETTNETARVDVLGDEKLQQLTTLPVAGYQEVQASSTNYVYYIQQGLGYLYSINLDTGEEVRISGTTVPGAKSAVITPDGRYALIQSTNPANATVFRINHTTAALELVHTLRIPSDSIAATTDNTFLYSEQTLIGLIGYEYDPATSTTTTLFTVPFRDAYVTWGDTARDAHYIYPKPSAKLEGYAYKITAGVLTRLAASGYGLTVTGNNNNVIVSRSTTPKEPASTELIRNTDEVLPLGISFLPEKCARAHETYTFVCASTPSEQPASALDKWHQGTLVQEDWLWEVDTVSLASQLILDPLSEVNRTLDVIQMQANATADRFYFQDKTTEYLWLLRHQPAGFEIATTTPSNP